MEKTCDKCKRETINLRETFVKGSEQPQLWCPQCRKPNKANLWGYGNGKP